MQFESPSEEEKQQTSCSLGVGILGTAAAALSSGAAGAKLAPQLKASRGLCECTNTLLSPLLSANTNINTNTFTNTKPAAEACECTISTLY